MNALPDYKDIPAWKALLTHAVPDVASRHLSHLADTGQVAVLAQVLPIARRRKMPLAPYLMAALLDGSTAVAHTLVAHWSRQERIQEVLERALRQGEVDLVPVLLNRLQPQDEVYGACQIALARGYLGAFEALVPHLDVHSTPALDSLMFSALRQGHSFSSRLLHQLHEGDQRALVWRIHEGAPKEDQSLLLAALDALSSEVSVEMAHTWITEAARIPATLPLAENRVRAEARVQALSQRPSTAARPRRRA